MSVKRPEPSKRGVIYITKLCNIRCRFCYYYYEKGKSHASLESIDRTFKWFKESYKLNAVDITGGEPTIHPEIFAIIKAARAYQLSPTIITNGQKPELIEDLYFAGLNDLLLSVHATGDSYDSLVQKKGAFAKLTETAAILKRKKFPFRTNTTLTADSVNEVDNIISWILDYRPQMVNLIAFNPHEGTEWSDKMNMEFQTTYTKMAEAAKKIINILNKENIWVNVRYMPLCLMKGHEEHVCNFMQWQFDPYEWETLSNKRLSEEDIEKIRLQSCNEFGETTQEKIYFYLMREIIGENTFIRQCEKCANRNICDGLYPQYLKSFGEDEFGALEGDLINDPLYYRLKDRRWEK